MKVHFDWWSVMLLAILIGGFCGPARAAQEQDKSTFRLCWPLGRSGTQHVLLEIPGAYGRSDPDARNLIARSNRGIQDAVGNCDQKDMILDTLWPGMEPDGPAIKHELSVPGGGRLMMALLKSSAAEDYEGRHYDALQVAFDVAVNWSAKHLCVSPLELQIHTPGAQTKCYPRDVPDAKAPEFGLNRLGVDFHKYPDIPEESRYGMAEQDIYYQRGADGKLQVVILCNAEEASANGNDVKYGRVPQCKHQFISGPLNAFVSIGYRRFYLEDWKAIQNSWQTLLTSFVVQER